ncbi:MAG TPA: hypothetical protein VLY03_04710 [Bacteroidota bacterium]|nr:hypothetical protein [Bacteroidota bacterium]
MIGAKSFRAEYYADRIEGKQPIGSRHAMWNILHRAFLFIVVIGTISSLAGE